MIATIETIHESLLNGQRKQMVEQIDEYGTYDFWTDYKKWLIDAGYMQDETDGYKYFIDAAISYFRIKNR
jgi:hypothetical protein